MRRILVLFLLWSCWAQSPAREVTVNLERPCSLRYRLDRPDSGWMELADLPSGSNTVSLPEQDIILQAWADQGLTRFSGERRVLSMAKYVDLRTSSSPCVPRIAALCITLLAVVALSFRWRLARQSRRLTTLESLKPDSSQAAIGSVIGNFRITGRLGRGGMGTVYRAEPLAGSGETTAVALKLIATEDAPNFTLERFRRECSTAARLQHPGLVRVLDYGMSGSFLFLALELVEGQTLRRLLSPQGLELPVALPLMRALTDAMSYCHQRAIIHCDLKPENIMVDQQGRVKILDFGLAREFDQQTRLTPTGLVTGTPAYLAPERFVHSQDLPTAQVDQYALGILFYELVTGVPPYESEDISLYGWLHVHQPVPHLADRRPDLPLWLGDMLTRMLQKSPSDRFPSLVEVAATLESEGPGDQDTQGIPLL